MNHLISSHIPNNNNPYHNNIIPSSSPLSPYSAIIMLNELNSTMNNIKPQIEQEQSSPDNIIISDLAGNLHNNKNSNNIAVIANSSVENESIKSLRTRNRKRSWNKNGRLNNIIKLKKQKLNDNSNSALQIKQVEQKSLTVGSGIYENVEMVEDLTGRMNLDEWERVQITPEPFYNNKVESNIPSPPDLYQENSQDILAPNENFTIDFQNAPTRESSVDSEELDFINDSNINLQSGLHNSFNLPQPQIHNLPELFQIISQHQSNIHNLLYNSDFSSHILLWNNLATEGNFFQEAMSWMNQMYNCEIRNLRMEVERLNNESNTAKYIISTNNNHGSSENQTSNKSENLMSNQLYDDHSPQTTTLSGLRNEMK
jgi:hypothetical protein